MARTSDPRKVLEWQRRMARFQKTQRSVAQFCQDEGVSAASFYRWRKKLVRRRPEAKDAVGASSAFTAVQLVASVGVVVQLPGGTQLKIPMSDPQALQLAIQAVARVDADLAGGAPC